MSPVEREDFVVVEKRAESERAVKLLLEGRDEHVWLPLSQIHIDGEQVEDPADVGAGDVISIPAWLAVEKELVE